jgi:hypothetical protein
MLELESRISNVKMSGNDDVFEFEIGNQANYIWRLEKHLRSKE